MGDFGPRFYSRPRDARAVSSGRVPKIPKNRINILSLLGTRLRDEWRAKSSRPEKKGRDPIVRLAETDPKLSRSLGSLQRKFLPVEIRVFPFSNDRDGRARFAEKAETLMCRNAARTVFAFARGRGWKFCRVFFELLPRRAARVDSRCSFFNRHGNCIPRFDELCRESASFARDPVICSSRILGGLLVGLNIILEQSWAKCNLITDYSSDYNAITV